MIQSAYCQWRPKSLERFLQNAGCPPGSDVGLVIAFENPWVLDFLLKMADRNLAGGRILVFDNSRRQAARRDIARICRDRDVPYLAMPSSPTRHHNRSHGMAMSWIFRNVVRAVKPRSFTFIDHDLIPVEKIELGATLGNQPFYGALKVGIWGWWTLWAGYCAYDFSAVRHLPLNFLNDFSSDLDTGGRNWPLLYKFHDRARMRFASRERTEVVDSLRNDGITPMVTVVDDRWIHLGKGYNTAKFRVGRNFYHRIFDAAAEGATLEALVTKKS